VQYKSYRSLVVKSCFSKDVKKPAWSGLFKTATFLFKAVEPRKKPSRYLSFSPPIWILACRCALSIETYLSQPLRHSTVPGASAAMMRAEAAAAITALRRCIGRRFARLAFCEQMTLLAVFVHMVPVPVQEATAACLFANIIVNQLYDAPLHWRRTAGACHCMHQPSAVLQRPFRGRRTAGDYQSEPDQANDPAMLRRLCGHAQRRVPDTDLVGRTFDGRPGGTG
jgi:hypothetical protein